MRNFPGTDIPLPESFGGSYSGGTRQAALGRRLALDRMVADADEDNVPVAGRVATPDDLQDATGVPVAMITVMLVDDELRAYLVVPGARRDEPTIMRLRTTTTGQLHLGNDGPVVELTLVSGGPEAKDIEVPLADGSVLSGQRGVIRSLSKTADEGD